MILWRKKEEDRKKPVREEVNIETRSAVLASRVSRLQKAVTKWDLDLEMLGWDASMQKTQRRSRPGLAVGKNSNFTNTIDEEKDNGLGRRCDCGRDS